MSAQARYGWVIVAALFVILTASSGLVFYGLSVYMTSLTAERGFAISHVSYAIGLFFVSSALLGMVIARLLERIDVRWIMTFGAFLGGTSLYLLGRIDSLWSLYLTFCVFGLSYSAVALIPSTTLVTWWFEEHRALALSVTSTGLSVGGVLITPMIAIVLTQRSLAEVMPVLAVVYVLLIVPLAIFLLRRPASHKQVGNEAIELPGPGYLVARRTRFFRISTMAYLLIMAAQVGGIAHLFNLASLRQDVTIAGLAISVMAGSSIFGRLAGGVIVHAWSSWPFTLINVALQTLALFVLALADSTPVLLAGTVLFGLSVGNLLMLQPLLLGEAFGTKDYARIYAFSQLFTMLGVAGGPMLAGAMFDLTDGSYLMAFAVLSAASALAGLLLLLSGVHPTRASDAT